MTRSWCCRRRYDQYAAAQSPEARRQRNAEADGQIKALECGRQPRALVPAGQGVVRRRTAGRVPAAPSTLMTLQSMTTNHASCRPWCLRPCLLRAYARREVPRSPRSCRYILFAVRAALPWR